jgi:hypothetical protein
MFFRSIRSYPLPVRIVCRGSRIVVQVYFHCSNTHGVLIDGTGASVGDMTDARDYAACVVRSLIMAANSEDWRDWMLHASDDLGEEIFVMSFASLLGKLH